MKITIKFIKKKLYFEKKKYERKELPKKVWLSCTIEVTLWGQKLVMVLPTQKASSFWYKDKKNKQKPDLTDGSFSSNGICG